MATTQNGFLFAWGLNMCGQLGLGDFIDRAYPEHIKSLAEHPIRQISCGYLHSGAVTQTGNLFMWGANPDCRLVKKLEYYSRSGRPKNFCIPQYCESMALKRIV
jgi:alpha-tubulin suppressor-like RCC1 family protein